MSGPVIVWGTEVGYRIISSCQIVGGMYSDPNNSIVPDDSGSSVNE